MTGHIRRRGTSYLFKEIRILCRDYGAHSNVILNSIAPKLSFETDATSNHTPSCQIAHASIHQALVLTH